MSEEILRAMMELFALIVKQDGGMLPGEREFVADFLSKQLPHQSADEFMQLFLNEAGPLREGEEKSSIDSASVRDSIRILNNCKKINKTLSQEQRVIVLLRCIELIESDRQFTPRRMNIINTIAEVFRISGEEFHSIMQFVGGDTRESFTAPSMVVMDISALSGKESEVRQFIVFLKIESVDLYFMKCFCEGTTLLNGLPVVCRRVYLFAPGSAVQAPPVPTIYFSDIVSHFASGKVIHRISFVADGINYSFPDGTRAITNVSFSAYGGMLIGIMGASGSGKTTLLNLLTGLTGPSSGEVRINTIPIHSGDSRLDGVVGYVPQDDLLVEDLTVFENLYFAASLCFAGKSRSEITAIVDKTLHSLGLLEKKNYRVGSPLNKVISGGQRKRLNIALELIREPSVLFLDEPTSGLSSADSENVMDLLHELTGRGTLIITVIHQPSSDIFKGFDRVLVLDLMGHLVFYGNPLDAVVHFKKLEAHVGSGVAECPSCGTVNPETLFNILETRVVDEFGKYTDRRKVSPPEWAEAFNRTLKGESPREESSEPWSGLRKPGWVRQTLIFLMRDLKSKIANRQYLLMILLEGPLLGLILSYIIRYIADPGSSIYIFRENENIPVYIFMSIIVALFLGLTISAEEIYRDRRMLSREHFLNLNRSSYLVSKILILAFISALQAFLFLVVANPILGIRGLFFSYWLALFATAFCASMLGLNISSALDSAIAIYIVIPLLMIPMMILSGAMFPFDKLNRNLARADRVPLIAEVMPTRWTYEALMVRQYTGNEYGKRVYPLRQQISISDFNTIYRIPRMEEALETVTVMMKEGAWSQKEESEIRLLRNETARLSSLEITEPFSGTDSLTTELFNGDLAERLEKWLNQAADEYSGLGTRADMSLDNYISSNKMALDLLYNNYHNDKLEDIVRKVYEKNKMLEFRDRLIQNVDLIYLEPAPAGPLNFRTHFMAPVKKFMGYSVDTYRFNIILVLSSTIILYIMLYTEMLRGIIRFFETSLFQKRKNLNRG
ncbi:MAG: ATP-binding cassette domain-containing protein [Bacteroidetes bacterium]|nr:MAG: ATP-binding cassette domain-containing protein [Bacteroidota bacterium]